MKKTKENLKNNNFTKLTRSGISLIVLVITIIVIIILAAAIIISLNNNNPIMEANTARYESDRANMQAVFTNTVAKIMAKNQATLTVSPGQINTITGGQKEVEGEVAYTLTDAQNSNYSSGKIVFDNNKLNEDTIFYTGKKLPIYAAGETKWYVDSEGNISLEVAGTKYGSGEALDVVEENKVTTSTLISGSNFYPIIPETTTEIIFTDEVIPTGYSKGDNISTSTWIDVTVEQDETIVAWMEDTTMKVSSQQENIKIKANEDCDQMFDRYTLENIDLNGLDTSNTTNMSNMFARCYNIKTLILPDTFDTSNVTNMNWMFNGCSKLTTLTLPESFDTSNVTSMMCMFQDCNSLNPLILPDTFDTSNVTNMTNMFYGCSSITTLTLPESFDTSNVTSMASMFMECSSLTSVILPDSFNTNNVTNMEWMFMNCYDLTLDCSSWDVSKVTTYERFNDSSINVIAPTWKN